MSKCFLTHLIPIDPDKVDFFQIDHGVTEVIIPPVMTSRAFASLGKVSMHDRLKDRRKWRHTDARCNLFEKITKTSLPLKDVLELVYLSGPKIC